MISDILDDGTLIKSNQRRRTYGWIAIIMMWIGIFYSGFIGLLFEPQAIIAAILILISTGITFYDYTLGVKVFLGIMLVGSLNLIDVFPYKLLIGFGLDDTSIGLEMVMVLISAIHLLTNKEQFYVFNDDLIYNEERIDSKKDEFLKKVLSFKKRYSRKHKSELKLIIDDKGYLPEAREAAKQLMNELND